MIHLENRLLWVLESDCFTLVLSRGGWCLIDSLLISLLCLLLDPILDHVLDLLLFHLDLGLEYLYGCSELGSLALVPPCLVTHQVCLLPHLGELVV